MSNRNQAPTATNRMGSEIMRAQSDPAEGSREVAERNLARQANGGVLPQSAPALLSDIAQLLGDASDTQKLTILALRPSMADLEKTARWIERDAPGKTQRPLTGTPAAILEIVTHDAHKEQSSRH